MTQLRAKAFFQRAAPALMVGGAWLLLSGCDAMEQAPKLSDQRSATGPAVVAEEPQGDKDDPKTPGADDGADDPTENVTTVVLTANDTRETLRLTSNVKPVLIAWQSQHATACRVEPSGWEGTSGSELVPAPAASVAYVVTCEGEGDAEATDAVNVIFDDGNELGVDLKINDSDFLDPLADGAVVQVSWTSTGGAEQCAVSPTGWTGGAGDEAHTVTAAVSFVATCTKGTQTVSDSVNLSLLNPPMPVATFALTGAQVVDYGDSLVIAWSSTNADACEVLETGWTGVSDEQTLVSITQPTTLTLVCTNTIGEDRSSLTVNVNPAPAPTAALEVNGSGTSVNVASGSTAAISWTSTQATSCAVSPFGWTALDPTDADVSPAINGNVTVVLTCVGPGGTVSDAVLIEVGASGGLTADIKAGGEDGPVSIAYGAAVTVAWTSDAAGCSVSPGGQTGATGSFSTGALTAGVTYTLDCTTGGNTKSDVVTVNVDAAPAPVVGITANNVAGAIAIKSGNSATIRWTATNATSCLVTSTPGTANWTGTAGARSTGALTVATAYTVTCTGPGGDRQATVTINMKSIAPTTDLRGNGLDGPLTLTSGASVALTWTSTDATACTVTPGNHTGTSGNVTKANLTASAVYTVSCTGDGGTATDTVVVNIQPPAPPSINVTANGADGPITVSSGSTVQLAWTSTGAASCSGPTGQNTTSGQVVTAALTTEKTYTVTCTNAEGTASDAVTVKIAAAEPETYTVTRTNNITFCTAAGANLALDLARPNGAPGNRPAIVFVHGGAWTTGSRAAWSAEIDEAATRGYVAVSISYRLTGALFPGQVEDVKCAVRWMRAKAALYSIDTARIGIAGKSAGAHLSMLAALTDGGVYEGSGGFAAQSSQVKAIVNWYGPTDMKKLYDASSTTNQAGFRAMFGGSPTTTPTPYVNASPITYVDADDPPIWTSHGTVDGTVPYEQATLMNTKATQVGLTFTLETITGAGHGFAGDDYDQAIGSMFQFFDARL